MSIPLPPLSLFLSHGLLRPCFLYYVLMCLVLRHVQRLVLHHVLHRALHRALRSTLVRNKRYLNAICHASHRMTKVEIIEDEVDPVAPVVESEILVSAVLTQTV